MILARLGEWKSLVTSNERNFRDALALAETDALMVRLHVEGTSCFFPFISPVVVTFDPPDAAKPGKPANGPTTCAWSGQAQVVGDMPYLITTWVLTGAVPREENWTATTIGTNYFFRSTPTPAMLGAALAL